MVWEWEREVWSEFFRLLGLDLRTSMSDVGCCAFWELRSGSGGSSKKDRRRKSDSSVVGHDPSVLPQNRGG